MDVIQSHLPPSPNSPATDTATNMPWEICIVKDPANERVPLGDRDEVLARFSSAITGLALKGPPELSPEVLAIMPDTVRESALRGDLEAHYECADLSISFYCENGPQITCILGDVSGNDDPIPVLAKICLPNDWSVIDQFNHSVVNLVNDTGI